MDIQLRMSSLVVRFDDTRPDQYFYHLANILIKFKTYKMVSDLI